MGFGAYYNCLKRRHDSGDFEFIGFESPNFKFLAETRRRFAHVPFSLIEKLVWTFDGAVAFDTDGESHDCRLLEVSCVEGEQPYRHSNPHAVVQHLPCVDLANYISQSFSHDDYLVLKLDIEGAEYNILERLIETQVLLRIKELYVEYHPWGRISIRNEIETYIMKHPKIYYRNNWP